MTEATPPSDFNARDPLLTVLIPTRDRWRLLIAQTRALVQELGRTDIDWEIVVHDNSSGPSPVAQVARLPTEVRYIRSAQSWDTAEENICAALHHCRGTYVWLLADDDGLEPGGLDELVRRIKVGEDDILVFNSRHGRDERVGGDGAYIGERARRLFYGSEWRCSISDFVQQTGFYYWLCAISTVVIRRSLARASVLEKYIGIARIYAHVAWLIEVGAGSRFVYINRPLVVYGLLPTDNDGGRHWRGVGIREGGYSYAVWTGLWLRTVQELIDCGAYTVGQLRRTIDMNGETRFHWGANLVHQTLEQICEFEDPVLAEDLEIMARWVGQLFPGAIFLSALLDDVQLFISRHGGASLRMVSEGARFGQASRAVAQDLRTRARWWRHANATTPWYTRLYVETLQFYDIYDFGHEWIGVHSASPSIASLLEVIDLPELPPVRLKAPTYEQLRERIEEVSLSARDLATLRQVTLELPTEWRRLQPGVPAIQISNLAAAPPAQIHVAPAVAAVNVVGAAPLPLDEAGPGPVALAFGETVDLAAPEADRFLLTGFSSPEPWGRWTDGAIAVLAFAVGAGPRARLDLRLAMVWTRDPLGGEVGVTVDRSILRKSRVHAGEVLSIDLGNSDPAEARPVIVCIQVIAPKTIAEEPAGEVRALGLGIESITLVAELQ